MSLDREIRHIDSAAEQLNHVAEPLVSSHLMEQMLSS